METDIRSPPVNPPSHAATRGPRPSYRSFPTTRFSCADRMRNVWVGHNRLVFRCA